MLIFHFAPLSQIVQFVEYRRILFGGGIVVLAADGHCTDTKDKGRIPLAEKASFPFSITVWGTCDGRSARSLAHPSSLIPFIKETSVLSSISFLSMRLHPLLLPLRKDYMPLGMHKTM